MRQSVAAANKKNETTERIEIQSYNTGRNGAKDGMIAGMKESAVQSYLESRISFNTKAVHTKSQ